MCAGLSGIMAACLCVGPRIRPPPTTQVPQLYLRFRVRRLRERGKGERGRQGGGCGFSTYVRPRVTTCNHV